jgi:phospholipid-binding lipoprotein MlaA
MKKNIIFLMLLGFSSICFASDAQLDYQNTNESNSEMVKDSDNQEIQNGISDPFESVNRKVYSFNKSLDSAVLKPVAISYKNSTPNFIQTGVTNIFNYIKTPINVFYFSLQGNGEKAGNAMGRLIINTFGFGVLDFATEVRIPLENTTLGETLGVWGVGEGPYIVLPVLGGATLRDTTTNIVDMKVSLINKMDSADRNIAIGVKTVDERKKLLPLDDMLDYALDEYNFVRDGSVSIKRSKIKDLSKDSE